MNRSVTLMSLTSFVAAVLLAFPACVSAAEPKGNPANPDFTKGDTIPATAKHDWNLGPTALRGWMFCDQMVTTDARQISITQVEKGSPADGVFLVGDVIPGVGGKPFSHDPRTEFGKALTSAEEIKPLFPAIDQAIIEPAPSGEMFADSIRVEGLRLLAKHHIEEGIAACVNYTRDQNPWAREHRTPELMKVLLSDGTHAKSVIPELTKIANYFEAEEKDFPKELMLLKAKGVRETIVAIEASTDTPELIHLK